jgi:hypothetical protein
MKLEQHRAKALRIERSLAKLADTDYEAVIEGAMLAGTHWFNLLLHRWQLYPESRDAMHAEFLTVGERRRIAVRMADALAALDTIEGFRTSHVRGDMHDGEASARTARACLERLRAAAESAGGEPPKD